MGEWKEYKLGEICDVRDGTHDSPKQSTIGKPLVTSKNIKGGNIDLENTYLISEEDFVNINRRSKVDQYDILFSMIGTVGESAIVKQKPDYAIKNVGLFKTGGDENLAKWIYYYLKSNQAQGEIGANLKGSTQQYISLGDLRKFPIEIPPLEEQEQITGVLNSLDDKIDLLSRQNVTLEAIAETLFRQYFIESPKEDCKDKSLFDCIKLVGGGTPKTSIETYWNGDICWLSGGDISDNYKGYVIQSEKTISTEGLSNSSAKLLPANATIISARGTVGKYCLLSKPMAFSQSNYGVLPQYPNCYFFTFLLIAYSVNELQSAAYGSVFDTITTNTFKSLTLCLPDEKDISYFELLVKPHFDKVRNNTLQIYTLTKLRDTLLAKLTNNEIKI